MSGLSSLGAIAGGISRGYSEGTAIARQRALDDAKRRKEEGDSAFKQRAQEALFEARYAREEAQRRKEEEQGFRRDLSEFNAPIQATENKFGATPSTESARALSRKFAAAPEYERTPVDTEAIDPAGPDPVKMEEFNGVIAEPGSFKPSKDDVLGQRAALLAKARDEAGGVSGKSSVTGGIAKPMSDSVVEKTAMNTDKLRKDFATKTEANFGTRSQFSVNQGKINAIRRINQEFKARPNMDFIPSEASVIFNDLSTIINAGNTSGSSDHSRDSVTTKTLRTELAKAQQYVSNNPTSAELQPFMVRIANLLDRELTTTSQINNEVVAKYVNANREIMRRDPAWVNSQLELFPEVRKWVHPKTFKVSIPEFDYTTGIRDAHGGVPGPVGELAPKAGPREGDKAKSKSGRPMTFSGGSWVYDG
jgi:hypothetical protein